LNKRRKIVAIMLSQAGSNRYIKREKANNIIKERGKKSIYFSVS